MIIRMFCLAILLLCGRLAPAEPVRLPQQHDYQKVLYKYMASLTEHDLTHDIAAIDEGKPYDQDPEYLYRNYLLTLMMQPMLGTKRGIPCVSAPANCFLLSNIERADNVYIPPVWPETLVSFVQWDFPGNAYRNNRALKLRAFMGAAVQLMMFHRFAEQNDGKTPSPIRPDWHGYNPVFWAAPYPCFKDVLPPEVQRAYETGLRMAGERILHWGIRGETCENTLLAPLGLVYISRALNDPAFTQQVQEHTRPLFTDPRYFHAAGYWDERGGPDTGFGGAANLYAAWIALMTDWPFANEALTRIYRLRGYLLLPEPDGSFTGPSHFNSRLGSPVNKDQQSWDGARDAAVAMLTDEAAQFAAMPAPDVLTAAPARRAHMFTEQITENLRDANGHYYTRDELTTANTMWPWSLRMWMSWNFPISQNPGYEFYRKGTYAHRQELEKVDSPLLKSPFLRGENSVRAFDKDFVVTRQPAYAAIVHCGQVGAQTPDDNKPQFPGPMGLGGGQLSAFWTPQAGPVILGLRSGMSYDKSFDVLDAWRTWPIHAVSGITVGGKVFTSARNAHPVVEADVEETRAMVKVSGPLMAMVITKEPGGDPAQARDQMYDAALDGTCTYSRTFKTDAKGVSVETVVNGDGKETLTEFYETIPVYMGYNGAQKTAANGTITLQVGGAWVPATTEYQMATAVKVTRFTGAVQITFDKARRVKLSPANWTDKWLNEGAACRNVLIDLLESDDKPAAVSTVKPISYRIEPVTQ